MARPQALEASVAGSDTDGRALLAIALLTVCVIAFFVGLETTPLWDPDEPRFAAATREMVATGDVMSPSFNGQPRFEKPILFYWLQLPFFLALGPTETAARLPSALAGAGCVVLLLLIGRRFFSVRAALLAALALATALRFVAYARQGLTDVPAMFFEMVALYGFIRTSEPQAASTRYFILGWTAIGLCALTKGPVALLPVAIWALHLTATRDRVSLARWRVGPGVLLACAICVPWFVFMTVVHGRGFVDLALGHEIIRRVIEFPGANRGVWYYARILPADALPWTIFFLLGCVHAVSAWPRLDPPARQGLSLSAAWFAAVFVLFSAASGKLPHYLLPIYPPLALVAGFYIDRVACGEAAIGPWRVAAAFTGSILIVLAALTARFLEKADVAASLEPGLLLPGVLAAGGVALIAVGALRRKPVAATFALVVSLVSAYAFLTTYTLPRQLTGLHPAAAVGRLLGPLVTTRDRVGMIGAVPSSALIFYSRHRVEPLPSHEDLLRFLEEPGRAFCVVWQSDLPQLVRDSRAPIYQIARQPKLVARFNRLFGRRTASLYDNDLVVLANQPVSPSARRLTAPELAGARAQTPPNPRSSRPE